MKKLTFFLSLRKGKDGELGFFVRIKRKVSRVKAMSEIADEMVRHGFEMTGTTVENKINGNPFCKFQTGRGPQRADGQ